VAILDSRLASSIEVVAEFIRSFFRQALGLYFPFLRWLAFPPRRGSARSLPNVASSISNYGQDIDLSYLPPFLFLCIGLATRMPRGIPKAEEASEPQAHRELAATRLRDEISDVMSFEAVTSHDVVDFGDSGSLFSDYLSVVTIFLVFRVHSIST